MPSKSVGVAPLTPVLAVLGLPLSLSRPPAAFLTQTIQLNDAMVKFEIWDTAGQERYHSLAPMYVRASRRPHAAHANSRWWEEVRTGSN